ncbi:sorting nexin-14-like isoform X2 [Asterias rubens]|uniref:sorting nexin-14-like isoform X2 n=1 Tax=Asterias rubens TaxID=7604 RepID=UPI0014555B7E|nr:sorting nexin-14-like isoform X2 [Asterias rubens]
MAVRQLVREEISNLRDQLRANRALSAGVGGLIVLTIVFYNYLSFLAIPWFFLAGMTSFYILFNRVSILPNLLIWYERKKSISKEQTSSQVCPVCSHSDCVRHKVELTLNKVQPWNDVYLPERVDAALSELLELILQEYVYSWYTPFISKEEEFVNELRMSLRFLIAVVIRRVREIDLPTFILDRLVKAALRHLDVLLRAKRKAKWGEDFQDLVIKTYGDHLHCAARNRKTEHEYLRNLCELLFTVLIPANSHNNKTTETFVREVASGSVFLLGMDVVADPDIVNKLLMIFFDEEPFPAACDPPSKQVVLLETFSNVRPIKKSSALQYEMSEILSNHSLLFPFLQYMKRDGALNILQFCLTVEDFNRRSLVPDMTDEQKQSLHREAQDLHLLYFAAGAVDKIKFDEDIEEEIQEIVNGPYEGVTRLRTSSTLFRAYEHAYKLMENVFCPLFHHSDEYYTLMCGKRQQVLPKLQQRTMTKRSSDPIAAMHRLGSKIKGVFRSSNADGDSVSLSSLDITESESSQPTSDAEMISDDEEPSGVKSPIHDLSAWRVSIPKIEARLDGTKDYFVYIIALQRIDVKEGLGEDTSWEVERRYHEFHVLEAKLREFHGIFEDAQLPSRRPLPFASRSLEFMEKRKESCEKFLQTLLTKPNLRSSQLLYSFLTKSEEFVNKFLGDVNLGKFVRTMSYKVIKERGQHLDPFLQSFIASVEAPKPKPGKVEEEIDPAEYLAKKLDCTIYGDNAGLSLVRETLKEPSPDARADILELNGVFDYILYLATALFEVVPWLYQGLIVFKKLFKNSLETFLDSYLAKKLEIVQSEEQVEDIIHKLRDVLFFDDEPPRTDAQKQRRKEEAFKQMMAFFPKQLHQVMGEDKFCAGLRFIFDGLQYPKLNKQLAYTLLDIIILEVFPEFDSNLKTDTMET